MLKNLRKFFNNYFSVERVDRILSAGTKGQILFFFSVVVFFLLILLLLMSVFQFAFNGDKENWAIFNLYYVFSGTIDLEREWSFAEQLAAIIVSFFGMVILSGGLVSILSNIVERRVEAYQRGLIVYKKISDHFVIIGYDDEVLEMIKAMLRDPEIGRLDIRGNASCAESSDRKILLFTHDDVECVRERIFSSITREERKRVLLHYGDIESRESLAKLKPALAKTIFIVGDQIELVGRDTKNLSCMSQINEVIKDFYKNGEKTEPVPVFVKFDGMPTYSIIQKIKFNFSNLKYIYPRPYNEYENWARLLWGFYGKRVPGKKGYRYRSLNYLPITDPKSPRYVHLVVIGLNQMGRALALEAMRICHYINFDEATGARKTRITIIDRDMEQKRDFFLAQYSNLSQMRDIEIKFIADEAESEPVRKMLREEALNPDCLLTVAACQWDPDFALATGLNLPKEVYWHYDEVEDSRCKKQLHTGMKKGGNTVLVRQSVYGDLGKNVDHDIERYRYVQVFGYYGLEFDVGLLADEIPMFIHSRWAKDPNREGMTPEQIAEAEAEDKRIVSDFKSYVSKNTKNITDTEDAVYLDFYWSKLTETQRTENRRKALRAWRELEEEKRWANRYQVEGFRTHLASIGLESIVATENSADIVALIERNKKMFLEQVDMEKLLLMADVEHRRWEAERTLAGLCAGEVRDDFYSIHCDFRRTDNLDAATRFKDVAPVCNIPYFCAMEGCVFSKIEQ